LAGLIKNHTAGAGSALVYGEDIAWHTATPHTIERIFNTCIISYVVWGWAFAIWLLTNFANLRII
jgi:hypothetical protein